VAAGYGSTCELSTKKGVSIPDTPFFYVRRAVWDQIHMKNPSHGSVHPGYALFYVRRAV